MAQLMTQFFAILTAVSLRECKVPLVIIKDSVVHEQ